MGYLDPMKNYLLLLICFLTSTAFADSVDCTEAYGTKTPQSCAVVTCNAQQTTFLGTWSGPFQAYVRELSTAGKNVYRPFQNEVIYSAKDCLKNLNNGDTFIIGRRTDTYPAFQGLAAETKKGLMITGIKRGSPFLRTVDENGVYDYNLIYRNRAANTTAWSLFIPATSSQPEIYFTIIDGQDFSEMSAHKRNVTITMTVAPLEKPIWEGVVSVGNHTLKP